MPSTIRGAHAGCRAVVLAAVLPLLPLATPMAAPLAAQHLPAPRFEAAPALPRRALWPARSAALDTPGVSAQPGERSTGTVIVGAVLGGALLGGAGAGLGYAMGQSDSGSDGLGEAIGAAMGLVLLEPIGLGIGANVANRGRGSAPLDVLVAAGTLVAVALVADGSGAYLVVPAQVAATVAVERALGRRARRAAAPEPRAAPPAPPDTAGARGAHLEAPTPAPGR